MVTVKEYLQLKTRLSNLRCSEKTVKTKERAEYIKKNIADITEQIKIAETQEDVTTYLSLIKKKQRLQQTIGSRKYYNKDASQLEEQLDDILHQIDILKEVPLPKSNQVNTTHINSNELLDRLEQSITKIESTLSISDGKSNAYYIINLAWTSIIDSVQNPVIEFMKMSNFISVTESANMITWKYSYDTIEERAQVKSLQVCASHLLEIVKKMFSDSWKIDAEIFGKKQQY